jgi:hypothetical protein
MSNPVTQLTLEIGAGDGLDDDALYELALRLRQELNELDVESVEFQRGGPAPPGSRAVELIALGTLLVNLLASTDVLALLVSGVQGWLWRSGRRSARLEIDGDVLELTGLSTADQRRLISDWIQRHADH